MGIADGFTGQRLAVLPRSAVRLALARPLTSVLLPTDCGLFPAARGHERRRIQGIEQVVLIACLHGRGWAEVAGRTFVVGPGELLAIAPDEAHAYGADADAPWTIRWLHLAGRLALPWLRQLGVDGAAGVRPLADTAIVSARHDEVLTALARGDGEPQLLAATAAAWHLLGTLATAPTGHTDPVERALALMRARLDGPLTVAALAAAAGLSPSRFTARFRTSAGTAPMDHFLRLKMRHAAGILETTILPVHVIAARFGYDDPGYFSRRFRTVFGVTPLAWRRMRRG